MSGSTIHRPNVLVVGVSAAGGGPHAALALRLGLYAVVLLAAGLPADFEGLLDSIASPTPRGWAASSPSSAPSRASSRSSTTSCSPSADSSASTRSASAPSPSATARGYLEIDVAGGDPVRVPIGRDPDIYGAVDRIESALETG